MFWNILLKFLDFQEKSMRSKKKKEIFNITLIVKLNNFCPQYPLPQLQSFLWETLYHTSMFIY